MQRKNRSNFVKCKVCGRVFETINSAHLSSHNLTLEEYKEKWPGAKTMATYLSKRKAYTDMFPDSKLFVNK